MNGANLDARNTLLADRLGRQQTTVNQSGDVDLQALVAKVVAIEQQRALNASERDKLRTRAGNLEIGVQILTAENDEHLNRIDNLSKQVKGLSNDTKKLKKQQCCMATCLILAGTGMVGGGAALIVGKSIELGIALTATGGTTLLTAGSAAAKTP